MIRLTSVPIQGRWVGFSTHRRRASLLTRCVCVAALNLAASVASAAGAAAREPRRVAAASRVTGRLSPLHMQLIPLIASELSLYTRSCSASAVAFRSDDRRSWTSESFPIEAMHYTICLVVWHKFMRFMISDNDIKHLTK